jgi:hypothetical protein
MNQRAALESRSSLIARTALVLAGVSTYLFSRDDVVWHFIKTAPDPQVLEHVFFGLAAVLLGASLLLKVKLSSALGNQNGRDQSRTLSTVASFLQAIGVGSLLPLPGFLLLAAGDLATSLLLESKQSIAEDHLGEEHDVGRTRDYLPRLGHALMQHIGLFLALLSMIVFSLVLVDRIADILFAMTAIISFAANLRRFASGIEL